MSARMMQNWIQAVALCMGIQNKWNTCTEWRDYPLFLGPGSYGFSGAHHLHLPYLAPPKVMIDIFSKARNKQLSEKKILAIRQGYHPNNPGTNIMACKG